MPDISYIASQIVTVIMYSLLAITYVSKNKRKILVISTLAIIANAVAFVLLNAWTGLAVCCIDLLRNFYLVYDEKKHGKRDKIAKRDVVFLFSVFATMAIAAVPTYEGPLSLLSIFASAVYTFSIWQKSTMVYKLCGMPVSILWISYNVFIHSIFGVILESVLLVVSIIGFIIEIKKNSKKEKTE